MKVVEIAMPLRKPLAEVTPEERGKFNIWVETRCVPETFKDAVLMLLKVEDQRVSEHGKA